MVKDNAAIIKRGRLKAGLTQEEAAALVCVSRDRICVYEGGRAAPPPDVVAAMKVAYRDCLFPCRCCNRGGLFSEYLDDKATMEDVMHGLVDCINFHGGTAVISEAEIVSKA